MAATIVIFNDGQKSAKTSHAFNCTITKDVMRDYELAFSLAISENACKYITESSTFQADGQLFDISSYEHSDGDENIIDIVAEHVSRRLNDYVLPARYSMVGTIQQIAQDMLNTAIASDGSGENAASEFQIGTCANVAGSYNPGNTDNLDLMTGLLGMTDLGVEMDYDNFTLDFPASIGSGMKHTFRFGVDLVKFKRTWNRDNGTTYEVKIADTQCIPGNAEIFALGDMADVEDSFFGDTVTGERIITYITCLDDPTQNSIILGVFILDSATQTATMQIAINNTVQQGDQYSNVSMDHLNGFMAVLNDGTYTTLNGEGLLHHDGATSAEYHYLTYEADITFTNILSPDFYAHNRVQLPDSFKNKNFTISLSIKSADASFVPSTKGVIQSVGAASFNPDFVNAIVDIGGMFIAYDVTGNAFYTGTSHLIVSLTAIA